MNDLIDIDFLSKLRQDLTIKLVHETEKFCRENLRNLSLKHSMILDLFLSSHVSSLISMINILSAMHPKTKNKNKNEKVKKDLLEALSTIMSWEERQSENYH